MAVDLICADCGGPVVRSRELYDTFERMHWVCFHYRFEHLGGEGDRDVACADPGCPARAFDAQAPPDWFADDS